MPTYRVTVVVSASKTAEPLIDAPATMTVLGPRDLALAPSTDYADLLRAVPGVNVTQLSARDVNITSRAATSSLATSELALLDGRTLYADFFGFVMWDFMPRDLDEIKQIEVIRGPASAVWGANALDGVINVITKSPREMAGTHATIGVGTFGREVNGDGASPGTLFYANTSYAAAVNDRWAYKVSAGVTASDPLARPVGAIPNGQATPTLYPSYRNAGTEQPQFDVRVDRDFAGGAQLQVSGGVDGTSGILHSGIGPFEIARGSTLGYGKVNYTRGAFKLQAFTNIFAGHGHNLLTVDAAGRPIPLQMNTKTTDIEAGDTVALGRRQAVTFGGDVRFSRFHLQLAPGETSRTEGGAYVQDELVLTPVYRIIGGARVDKFTSIARAVVSPRVAFVVKPTPRQAIRVTFNRAFRAPSIINNDINATIANPLPLAAISPAFGSQVFLVPTAVTGNKQLTEEHLDAFEVGYTGQVRDRATLSAAWYVTRFSNEIFFTQTGTWTTAPPGFPSLGPVPAQAVWAGLLAKGIVFPSTFTYKNLGKERNQGLELGLNASLTSSIDVFGNYSFQARPIPSFPGLTASQALAEVNLPARHRVNVGASFELARAFGSASVSHVSAAFWQDVLDARYHGETAPYTLIDLTLGTRWRNGRYTAALKVTNLANRPVMEHVFGDVLRRQVVGELKVAVK